MTELVKICGLTTIDAVRAADGADYAGFVVGSPQSHRNISLDKFDELSSHLNQAKPVLVTVNHNLRFLHKLRSYNGTIIQLHGTARNFAKVVDKSALGLNIEEYTYHNEFRDCKHKFLSIDSTKKNGYGGTGTTWNWVPIDQKTPSPRILIAGGIGIENVESALKQTKADGVDVSSSMETRKRKDPVKIRDFIDLVRGL